MGNTVLPLAPKSLPDLAQCRTANPFSAAAAWAQEGQKCHILTTLFGSRFKEHQLAFEIIIFNKFCGCPFMKTWTNANHIRTVTPTLMTRHTSWCGRPSSRNHRNTTNGLFSDKGQAGHSSNAVFTQLAAQLPQLPEMAAKMCQKDQAPTPRIGSKRSPIRSARYRCL